MNYVAGGSGLGEIDFLLKVLSKHPEDVVRQAIEKVKNSYSS